jgi:hypothetical protein
MLPMCSHPTVQVGLDDRWRQPATVSVGGNGLQPIGGKKCQQQEGKDQPSIHAQPRYDFRGQLSKLLT